MKKTAWAMILTLWATSLPAQSSIASIMEALQQSKSSTSSTKQAVSFDAPSYKSVSVPETQFPISDLILDHPIDSLTYIVGTGDMFHVFIWGNIQKTFSLTVGAEGSIIIPMISSISVAGKTLADVKNSIRTSVKTVYPTAPMEIQLVKPQRFKVQITGAVERPGTFTVEKMTRVSDLIEQARGFSDGANQRRVLLITLGGDTIATDLAAFKNNCDLTGNPYIPEGVRVHVPLRTEMVAIFGAINIPSDTIDYVPGETVSHLIQASGGFARGVDSSKIQVTRFTNRYDSLTTFELTWQESQSFRLNADDHVLVCAIPQYRIHRTVTISGEVAYPGTYPIRDDKTRIVDVIAAAGGLTDNAYLRGSKIVRKEMDSVGNREFNRLKSVPPSSLNPLERSYLKTMQTEEDGLVSIDFEKLFGQGTDLYNLILRNDDRIVIEKKPLSVKVMGAVVSPGLISYVEGQNYRYYIEQAGGYNKGARKSTIKIVKGGSEVITDASTSRIIEAGDAVWIPEKEYRNGFQLSKDILLMAGSVATVLLSIISVGQLIK